MVDCGSIPRVSLPSFFPYFLWLVIRNLIVYIDVHNQFDPSAVKGKKDIAQIKKKAQESIKGWVLDLLPEKYKPDVEMVVCREFQCGDPKCAPIDTAIQVFFKEATRQPLQIGLPKECQELTREDIVEAVEDMLHPELKVRCLVVFLKPWPRASQLFSFFC